jgi:hypothetical protein
MEYLLLTLDTQFFIRWFLRKKSKEQLKNRLTLRFLLKKIRSNTLQVHVKYKVLMYLR